MEHILDWFFREKISMYIIIIIGISCVFLLIKGLNKYLENVFEIEYPYSGGGSGAINHLTYTKDGKRKKSNLEMRVQNIIGQKSKRVHVSARFLIESFAIVVCIIPGILFYDAIYNTVPQNSFLYLPDPVCHSNNNEKLIVFIHGWNGDSKNTWEAFPKLVCNDSRLKDYNVLSIPYPTYMKRRGLSIALISDWLDERLDSFEENGKIKELSIIAHSMGGVVAREIVISRKLGSESLMPSALITIASPFNGTSFIGSLASMANISTDFTDDMRDDSPYLNRANKQWLKIDKSQRPFNFCISSYQDDIVEEQSAFYSCDGTFTHLVGSHTDIVKPPSKDHMYYEIPLKHLLEILQEKV